MALTDQDRDRIREEEWVRLQAQEDFYKNNPGLWRYGRRGRHPGYVLAFAGIVAVAAIVISVVEHLNWESLVR